MNRIKTFAGQLSCGALMDLGWIAKRIRVGHLHLAPLFFSRFYTHHREDPRLRVLEGEVLVRELHAVDGLAPRAVVLREVARLAPPIFGGEKQKKKGKCQKANMWKGQTTKVVTTHACVQ
jgi:hypothetical protein